MGWVTRWKLDDQASPAFRRGADAIRREEDKLVRSTDMVGAGFAKLGGLIAGAITVATVKKVVDLGDSLWTLHERTGMSVKTLSTLGLAADRTGGSLEGVADASKFLAQSIAQAIAGSEAEAAAFRAIGLAAEDLIRLSPDEAFLQTARALGRVEGQATKTAVGIQIFGRAVAESLPLFSQIDSEMEAVAKFGELGDEFAKNADAFNDSLAALGRSLTALAAASLTDGLAALATKIEALAGALAGLDMSQLREIATGGFLGAGLGAALGGPPGAVVGAGAGMWWERAVGDLERARTAQLAAGMDRPRPLYGPSPPPRQPFGPSLPAGYFPQLPSDFELDWRKEAGYQPPSDKRFFDPSYALPPLERPMQPVFPVEPMFPPAPGVGAAPGIGLTADELEDINAEVETFLRGLEDARHQTEQIDALFAGALAQGVHGVASGIADVVLGMESWRDLGASLLDLFKQIVAQLLTAVATQALINAILPGSGVAGGLFFARGGVVPQYLAPGGLARGTDTVPAMLTPGEGVLTREATQRLGGARGIAALNRGGEGAGRGDVALHLSVGTLVGSNGMRELASMLHPELSYLIRHRDRESLARS